MSTRTLTKKDIKIKTEETYLPLNPDNKQPIILIPKRWLRYVPWVNYEDYFLSTFFM